MRLGIPTKLVPQQASDANGTKWTSPTGTVQIQLARRKEANPTTAKLAEREKKEPGRTIDYTVVKPDFFVLSGLQGLKKFYLRGTFKGDEVRILTILYDQATENTVEPVVIAMSSAFNAFPAGAQVAGPPPRKTVEYGTGVVVSDDGAIVTDRQITDGCLAIAIAGYRQCRSRRRGQGARSRAAAHLRRARTEAAQPRPAARRKPRVDLTGIADPQNQGGGAAVEQRQGVGRAARRRQRRGAVAGAGARLFRRGGARWRRQVRRHRAVEAGAWSPDRRMRAPAAQAAAGAADTVRAFPQGQWRQCGQADRRSEGVRGRVICVTEVMR